MMNEINQDIIKLMLIIRDFDFVERAACNDSSSFNDEVLSKIIAHKCYLKMDAAFIISLLDTAFLVWEWVNKKEFLSLKKEETK